jgi:hypothetical protein
MYELKAAEKAVYADKYLIVDLGDRSLITYQEDMLNENHLPGFLSFYSKFESSYNIYYNITGRMRLTDVLKGNKLPPKRFLSIIDSLADALLLREQYFLSENSLIIHQDYMYLSKRADIGFTYVPAELDEDYHDAFNVFAAWLASHVDMSKPAAADTIVPIHMLLKRPNYTAADIKGAVELGRMNSSESQPVRIPGKADNPTPEVFSEPPDMESAEQPKKKGILSFGRPIKAKEKIDKPEKPEKPLKKAVKPASDEIVIPGMDIKPAKPAEPAEPVPVIKSSGTKQAYLKSPDYSKKKQLVRIDKEHFTLGRQRSSDLVIEDMSVSRAHAELTFDKRSLSIADTNSTGGTFVNGERVLPGKPVDLRDNDVIRLAGVEYIVKITD